MHHSVLVAFPQQHKFVESDKCVYCKPSMEYIAAMLDNMLAPYDESRFDEMNPIEVWDWFVVGGRWARLLPARRGFHGSKSVFHELDITKYNEMVTQRPEHYDAAIKADIQELNREKALTYALLTPYHGYRASQTWVPIKEDWDKNENWDSEFWRLYDSIPDNYWIVIVDCHD